MQSARLDVSMQSYVYPGTAPNSTRTTLPGWFLITPNTVAVTYVAATGTFTTATAHGLSVGNWVWFTTNAGPALTNYQRYYVVSVPTATTFKVSAAAGGTAITTGVDGTAVYVSSLTGQTHTLYMQPQRFGEGWKVERVTVQSNSLTLVPTASIYRGVISPSALIDQSQNGQQDTDDLSSPLILMSGETIIVQFTFVDPPTPTAPAVCTTWLGGITAR